MGRDDCGCGGDLQRTAFSGLDDDGVVGGGVDGEAGPVQCRHRLQLQLAAPLSRLHRSATIHCYHEVFCLRVITYIRHLEKVVFEPLQDTVRVVLQLFLKKM